MTGATPIFIGVFFLSGMGYTLAKKIGGGGVVDYQDVENIIELLDSRMNAGTSRINLHVEDTVEAGEAREVYHHGRCDVGSPWAKGTAGNFGDAPDGCV